MFETSNRRLEQFLFAHMIFFEKQYKSPDTGLNVWSYIDTEELREVVDEFNRIIQNQNKKKG